MHAITIRAYNLIEGAVIRLGTYPLVVFYVHRNSEREIVIVGLRAKDGTMTARLFNYEDGVPLIGLNVNPDDVDDFDIGCD